MMVMKRFFLALTMCLFFIHGKAQMLAVNTDVAFDAMAVQNLGMEMTTGNSSTIGVSVLYANNPYNKAIKFALVQPEWRFYFSGRPMHSHFVGLCAIGGTYDFTNKGKVRDGYGAGIGITFGYVWNLTKRLSLDIHGGLGCIAYRQKEYYEGDYYDEEYTVNGNVKANASGYWLLPTKIGMSLSYILK